MPIVAPSCIQSQGCSVPGGAWTIAWSYTAPPPINDHTALPVACLLEHRHGVGRYAIPLRTAVDASLVGQVIEPRRVLAMPGVWTTGEQEHGDNNQHGPFSTHCCAPCWLLNFGLRPSAGSIPVKNSRLPVCTAST